MKPLGINTYQFHKKINLKNWIFLLFLVFTAIYILAMSINLFIMMSYQNLATKTQEVLKQTTVLTSEEVTLNLQRKYLISYGISMLLIITFIFYSLFAKNRIRIGYCYCTIWLIIWIGIIVAPIILIQTYDIFFIINCLIVLGILIGFFFVIKDLYYHRELLKSKIARLKR